MMTQQHSGFPRRIQRPLRSGAAWILAALALAACTPSQGSEEPRYPEKRRPPPLRSASDGEIMGANRQSPEDTLEGSPTNLHPAKGWEGEKGAMERAKEGDCDPEAPKAKTASATEANQASAAEASADATAGRPHPKKPCPKPAAR
jgi:hypothetical protein